DGIGMVLFARTNFKTIRPSLLTRTSFPSATSPILSFVQPQYVYGQLTRSHAYAWRLERPSFLLPWPSEHAERLRFDPFRQRTSSCQFCYWLSHSALRLRCSGSPVEMRAGCVPAPSDAVSS